jgi:hypothetical protein
MNIIKESMTLFNRAATAWEDGNNSGNAKILAHKEKECKDLRSRAEKLLMPLGIKVDYPGLYPIFRVNGRDFHDIVSAVDASDPMGLL